ncbi:EF-hand calcium-binding domain-containing protein 11 [Caloenas nicobarica]|uniref:EF-hand calcium-binding domain-containing protein 11 n=1 Tax=Caloenas nicobarica TaxID=187106 RepID=UPI0032B83CA8
MARAWFQPMGARAALVPQRRREACWGRRGGAQRPGRAERRDFGACHEDNKGYLSREDFKVAVVMLLGFKILEVGVESAMSSVGPQNSGLLFGKFLNLMSAKAAAHLYRNETRQIFTVFDVRDRGFLTFEDFKKAFNSLSPQLPEKIIVEAFKEVDQDSDGCISFKEFESAMKYGQDEVSPVYFA